MVIAGSAPLAYDNHRGATLSNDHDTFGVYIGFGSRRSISSPAELDELVDNVASYADDEGIKVAMVVFYPDDDNDYSASSLHFGVGAPNCPLEYGNEAGHQYVPGSGYESTWWYFMCDYSEVPPGREVPIELARTAAREFVRTRGQRPRWFNWIDESVQTDLSRAS